MITLIIGTPDSGKSLLAENLCNEQAFYTQKYYIATMSPFGDEGLKRVKKHRTMREGKDFITLEWPDNIEKRLADNADLAGNTILLECMSNLVGNELYSEENAGADDEALVKKVICAVFALGKVASNLIIVSNDFLADDAQYDDEDTKRYIRLTAKVNEELIALADLYYLHENGEWKRYEAD